MELTCKERHRWGTSVGYYGEPGVLRDHGGSGCLFPFGTGGDPPCYHCGVASAQCGGIGSPVAVVPLCQVTLLASSPSLHHAYHGSLVTPSVCFWTPPCVQTVPVCVMCDVTTCGFLSFVLSVAIWQSCVNGREHVGSVSFPCSCWLASKFRVPLRTRCWRSLIC